MKKSNVAVGSLVLGFIGFALYFFPWPQQRNITCQIRERTAKYSALQPAYRPTDTGVLDLQVQYNQSETKSFVTQTVKDVKVKVEVGHGSLNIVKLFGRQFVIPAWTIIQTFEDLKTGAKSSSLSFTPKILSDFRGAEWADFQRSNGDFVGTECALSKMVSVR
ncbi:MAG: hypothetical protein ACXWRU_18590 [Pseudobdellovibrionaceae bacterium]